MCFAAWWLQCAVVLLMYSGGGRTVDPLGNFWKGQVVLLCYSCKEYVIKAYKDLDDHPQDDTTWCLKKSPESYEFAHRGLKARVVRFICLCLCKLVQPRNIAQKTLILKYPKRNCNHLIRLQISGESTPTLQSIQDELNHYRNCVISFASAFFLASWLLKKPATRPPPVWGHEVSYLSCLPLQLPHLGWRRSRFRCVGA